LFKPRMAAPGPYAYPFTDPVMPDTCIDKERMTKATGISQQRPGHSLAPVENIAAHQF
jgi:hypothetical protein